MAILTNTELESHPVNTTGLNGIINGNWERIEAIISGAITAGRDGQIGWDGTAKTFVARPASAALSYAASVQIDFQAALQQTIALTGDLTLTQANVAAGRRVTVILDADGSTRNLTFPSGWVFLGAAAPASIAANKRGKLELEATGAAEADVTAIWTVEP